MGKQVWESGASPSRQALVTDRSLASPDLLEGGTSTAGQRLFSDRDNHRNINQRATLHLTTSNRSLLDGRPELAKEIGITQRFPIFLSCDLNQTRWKLKTESLAESRFGLAGSSGAARLRAEGLEPSSTFTQNIHGTIGTSLLDPIFDLATPAKSSLRNSRYKVWN
jgi:hypothetical protein